MAARFFTDRIEARTNDTQEQREPEFGGTWERAMQGRGTNYRVGCSHDMGRPFSVAACKISVVSSLMGPRDRGVSAIDHV